MMKNRGLLVLIAATFFLFLLFLNRAFFIDDSFYFTVSRDIYGHPLRPYDFTFDEYSGSLRGWAEGEKPNVTPAPLLFYYLGVAMKVLGPHPVSARFAFLLFPLAGVLLMYFIARKFTRKPLYAAVLMLCTPAFLVTNNSLSPDALLLALFLAAIAGLIRGDELNSAAWFLAAGCAGGLACLAKYTGILVFPVAALYIIFACNKESKLKSLLFFITASLVFFAWCLLNLATYGKIHFLETFGLGIVIKSNLFEKMLIQLSFIGGGFIFVLFAAYFTLMKKGETALKVVLAVSAALLFLFLRSGAGGFTAFQSLLLTAFIFGSLLFLLESVRTAGRDGGSLFLLSWLLLVLLVMLKLVGCSAVRYFLVLLPPACILFVRMCGAGTRTFLAAVLVTFALGASVLFSDNLQAGMNRRIAADLSARKDLPVKNKRYFCGGSFVGIHYYLTAAGWQPLMSGTKLRKGDLVLFHRYSFPVMGMYWEKLSGKLKPLGSIRYDSRFPVRVMNKKESAGFYSSFMGSLPFTFSVLPLEEFYFAVFETT